jgi:CHAT domain-containing protein/antitoxin component YwqK of YwqJK toxin-antitoxin module
MRNHLISLIVLINISMCAFAQVPKHPNELDAAGRRQGMWTYLYDQGWNVVNNPDSAAFYRVARYKDGQPVGITHDYYKNGKVQWQGKILQEEPQILDSLITEYTDEGTVLRYDYFVNGQADFNATIEHYNKTMADYKVNTSISRSAYAMLLRSFGALYSALGSFEQSEAILLEAIQVQKKVGINDVNYASLLEELSRVETELDDQTKAESLNKEALRIRGELSGKESIDYANTLNNISTVYYNVGNFTKSLELAEEAVQIYEKNNVTAGEFYATLLGNLSVSLVKVGQMKRAEELGVRCLQLTEEAAGREDPLTVLNIKNLARLYTFTGQYSKSEKLFLEAIDLDSKLGQDVRHPNSVITANHLAQVYAAMGQNEKAKLYFKKGFTRSHYMNAQFNEQHANFYFDQKIFTQADSLYAKSVAIRLKQIEGNFISMSEQQREDYFDNNIAYFLNSYNSFAVSNYGKRPAIAGEMYDLQLVTKAILLNNSAKWKQRIKTSGDVKLFSLYQEWDGMAKRLARAESEGELPEVLTELRTKTEELEKTLTKRSELFSKLVDKKKYTWKDVASKLKPDEAAIEIIRFRKRGIAAFIVDSSSVDLKRYPKYDLTDTIYYAALIVKQGVKNPKLVLLKNGNDLENKSLKYYQNSVRTLTDDKLSYDQYWNDIAKELKGIRKTHLSADGVYHRINVNTLKNPKTGKYVLDEMELVLVTNTKDMLLPKPEPSENKYALLVGMPDFGLSTDLQQKNAMDNKVRQRSGGAGLERSLDNLAELPGTKEEVETVAALLQAQGWQADVFLRENALEENIKDAFKPSVLHIATHGYFKEDTEEWSAGDHDGNPLLRSGLVLAGAGREQDTSTDNMLENKIVEDGILTAYEAMNLNLDNTEIVVLSACETGLGDIRNGEGVYGLQRAFIVAGAKSIVMSLWKVNDETTQEVMVLFYENWLKGGSKADAFRQAQFELRKKYPSPYYWGAFVMVERE